MGLFHVQIYFITERTEMGREVDHKLKWGNQTEVVFQIEGADIGLHSDQFEYKSMLNGGQLFRGIFVDPYQTILDTGALDQKYFDKSRSEAPLKAKFKFAWGTEQGGPKYTEEQEMYVVSMEPYDTTRQDPKIEIVGVDKASYNLSGGGASGEVFEGKVKKVLEDIVKKYGRGTTAEVKSDTQDDDNNQWWMYRLDPQTLIKTILEWSSKITKKKVEWFVYPDNINDKLIIVQQSDVESIARATYNYRGFPTDPSTHGDIIEHQMFSDNILQMYRHNVITSGLSAVSGAYYDKIIDENKKEIVHVGDKQTKNKYKAKVGGSRAFKRPNPDKKPPKDFVGWTHMPAIPEHSAGELGIRYDKYMDGYARNQYLRLNPHLMRCRFRIQGHYIWSGSEGLGVDTIKIISKSRAADGNYPMDPFYLHDNWIVYGYHHHVLPEAWYTDLYCSKIDRDASARLVGM